MTESLKRKAARAWREWLRSILLVVLIVTAFRSAVADWNDVPTGSMKPTILEGDRIVVNKLAYDLRLPYTGWRLLSWDDPARGDIVVLFSPADDKRLVKRVVGLPGDRIGIRGGSLIVNGKAVGYSPLAADAVSELRFDDDELPILASEQLGDGDHPVMISPASAKRSAFRGTTVPAGHYFVMGDNRDHSLDSRHFGPVRRDRIVGRATAVAASVDPERSFLPRWKRFLKSLR